MTNSSPSAFSSAIKHLRKERGLSQMDLAAKAELRQSYISAIELGTKAGTETTRRRICAALGWPYEAVLELGARIERGEHPGDAAEKAFALHDKAVTPPFSAVDTGDLKGFRVHHDGEVSDTLLWADRRALGGRNPAKIRAYLVGPSPGVLALVDQGARKLIDGATYMVRLAAGGPLLLRRVEAFPGSFLLTGLNGEREATALPFKEIVVGRVLWYQVNLELAE